MTRPVVLHVTECYEGGVSLAVRAMARNTPEFEHILLASGRDVESELRSGVFERIIKLRGSLLRRTRKVGLLTVESGAAVVHAHSSWAGVYARLLRLPVPVVYQPHGYAFEKPRFLQRVTFRSAERILAPRADRVAVLSQREALLAREVGPRSRIFPVPNVPTVEIARGQRAFPKRPTVVMVGRLVDQKDPGFFAAVLEHVQRVMPEARGLWIGDGEVGHREVLEARGIEVTGWLDPHEVTQHLDRAAIYVHSARYEGFPLSVLDAAARGLPVIARDIPTFDQTALTRAATVPALADAAVHVLSNEQEWCRERARTARLIDEMNPVAQHDALIDLWDFGGGGR